MRKVLVTALVALLVTLAFASCDGIINGDNDDGLVTLSINTGEITGSNRSINDTLAKQEANFVEVIFKKKFTIPGTGGSPDTYETKYYQAEGYKGQTLKIKIPKDTYTIGDDNDAIVLIGNKTDGTLLATGALTTSPQVVDDSTTEIVFTVHSLTVSIAANLTSSSFKITNLGGTPGEFTLAPSNTTIGSYEDEPCFQVPATSVGVVASLAFGGLDDTGANITLVNGSTLTPPVTPVIFNKISGTSAITTPVISTVNTGNLGPETPAAAGTVPAGVINITFDTGAKGAYFITFKIPVVGFVKYVSESATPGLLKGHTWFIRVGTESDTDFSLAENDSLVLLVKDSLSMNELVVKPDWQ